VLVGLQKGLANSDYSNFISLNSDHNLGHVTRLKNSRGSRALFRAWQEFMLGLVSLSLSHTVQVQVHIKITQKTKSGSWLGILICNRYLCPAFLQSF
jgi:hypothetical protein